MLDRDRAIKLLQTRGETLKFSEREWFDVSDEDLNELFEKTITNRIKNLLRVDWIMVKFTKINGEKRTMICTLAQDLMPSYAFTEGHKPKIKQNSDTISVWSRDDEGWRSFRVDLIEEVWRVYPLLELV